jgi:uncharacterized protein with NRDE domain
MDIKEGFEGGTWLAMNSQEGHVSVLLNVRQPAQEFRTQNVKGRGHLVPNCLQALRPDTNRRPPEQIKVNADSLKSSSNTTFDHCNDAFLRQLQATRHDYNGFVFVTLRLTKQQYSLRFFHSTADVLSSDTKDGVHAFGNHRNLSNPWAKVRHGKQKFEQILIKHDQLIETDRASEPTSDATLHDVKSNKGGESHSINVLIDDLFELFQDETRFETNGEFAAQMPEVSEQLRQRLSSISLHLPELRYGSRYGNVALVWVFGGFFCLFEKLTIVTRKTKQTNRS